MLWPPGLGPIRPCVGWAAGGELGMARTLQRPAGTHADQHLPAGHRPHSRDSRPRHRAVAPLDPKSRSTPALPRNLITGRVLRRRCIPASRDRVSRGCDSPEWLTFRQPGGQGRPCPRGRERIAGHLLCEDIGVDKSSYHRYRRSCLCRCSMQRRYSTGTGTRRVSNARESGILPALGRPGADAGTAMLRRSRFVLLHALPRAIAFDRPRHVAGPQVGPAAARSLP